MKKRKAQSQILTTILIILLVLAIVVIVWQVISKAVSKGAEKIKDADKCLGVLLEIAQPSSSDNTKFKIKRIDSKELKEAVNLLVIVDGKPTEDYTFPASIVVEDFKVPFTSAVITFNTPVTESIEAAIKVGDVICSSTLYEL